MIQTCVVCGAAFAAPPSSKKITCSGACATARKRLSHGGVRNTWSEEARERQAARGQTPNLRQGTPAAQRSPLAGRFETNQEAKSWEIVDLRSGRRYELRNLRKFCRDHAAEFAPDPWENAYAGLRQVQLCLMGKTKRAVTRWKDWSLVRPAEHVPPEES